MSSDASSAPFRLAASAGPRDILLACLLLGSIVAAGAIVVSALLLALEGYSALPFWDQWEFISPAAILGRFFEQHNEHRILLTRLITLLDQTAFGGRNLF